MPLAEQSLPFIESGKLLGGFKDAADVDFSFQKWTDGSYQHQKELYLNDKTGFRPDMVRVNNQIDYSFFKKCHTGWTIAGLDDFLFQWPYIDAYYGNDYVGYDTILEKTRKLKAIQDTMSRSGKSLIIVYAPSKATYYPEYFPADRTHEKKRMTNLQAYRHVADSMGINQVDMDTWFLSMKNKSKELLFSKQGIHWTTYGAILAGDSLMKYIEKLQKIHIIHPDWSKMEHTDKPRLGDDDVARELNLIFPITKETYAYPIIQDVPDSGWKKPNVIYIGDSYCFKMVGFGIIDKMNAQCEYWGYFKEIRDIHNHSWIPINGYDWKGAINKSDCVLLVYTTFNLKELGNGFIEAAYDYYYPVKNN